MSLAYDEYGRPFIVLREQDTKTRIKGIEAIKVIINMILEKYFGSQISCFNIKVIFRSKRT